LGGDLPLEAGVPLAALNGTKFPVLGVPFFSAAYAESCGGPLAQK